VEPDAPQVAPAQADAAAALEDSARLLQDFITHFKTRYTEGKRDLADLEADRTRLLGACVDSQIMFDDGRHALEELEAEIEQAHTTLDSLRVKTCDANAALNAAQHEHDAIQQHLATARCEVQAVEQTLVSTRARLASSEDDLELAEQATSEAQTGRDDALTALHYLISLVRASETYIGALVSRVIEQESAAQHVVSHAEDRFRRFEKATSEEQVRRDEAHSSLAILNHDIAAAQAELERIRYAKRQEEGALSGLSCLYDEMLDAQRMVSMHYHRRDILQADLTHLTDAIDTARVDLHAIEVQKARSEESARVQISAANYELRRAQKAVADEELCRGSAQAKLADLEVSVKVAEANLQSLKAQTKCDRDAARLELDQLSSDISASHDRLAALQSDADTKLGLTRAELEKTKTAVAELRRQQVDEERRLASVTEDSQTKIRDLATQLAASRAELVAERARLSDAMAAADAAEQRKTKAEALAAEAAHEVELGQQKLIRIQQTVEEATSALRKLSTHMSTVDTDAFTPEHLPSETRSVESAPQQAPPLMSSPIPKQTPQYSITVFPTTSPSESGYQAARPNVDPSSEQYPSGRMSLPSDASSRANSHPSTSPADSTVVSPTIVPSAGPSPTTSTFSAISEKPSAGSMARQSKEMAFTSFLAGSDANLSLLLVHKWQRERGDMAERVDEPQVVVANDTSMLDDADCSDCSRTDAGDLVIPVNVGSSQFPLMILEAIASSIGGKAHEE
jgi:chromosome segregation ATPase